MDTVGLDSRHGPLRIARPELAVLSSLDVLVRSARTEMLLEPVLARLEARLSAERDAPMVWEPIALETLAGPLPGGIRSSWVFILRTGPIEPERHPNSHQRTLSYRGAGDLRLRMDGAWRSHPLISDPVAPLERRWASIPAGVWHRPIVDHGTWVVVSFHTASAEELVAERQDDDDPSGARRETYVTRERPRPE